jgi:GTP-binding protein
MAQRDDRKRLGKKHRQASTRPKQGRAPRTTPTTGAVTGKAAPRKRKSLATKRATLAKQKRTPTRSPEHESHKIVSKQTPSSPKRKVSRTQLPTDNLQPATPQLPAESPAETRAWREAEILAAQLDLAADSAASRALPLIAICGRPNVGKSTLFNRLTGSRRSIVGDEPGITRDRIYGRIEWQSADARLVDTGGIVPDDPDLIPAEIFLQARTALAEAAVIIMVVDGRTELASPDIALARLLLRGGKPTILAVNKIDTTALAPAAENFRRLGFRNVLAISAEHGTGIGDLLDEVFAALPAAVTPKNVPPVAFLTEADELDEDATGPDFAPLTGSVIPAQPLEAVILAKPESPYLSSTDNLQPATDNRPRRLRSHGAFVEHETKIAIIGRPNVGKSTLLNALTGSARAIVSPIAGTTRDAVDEVVTRAGHDFRFVDTAGIRRKGKTKLMAEKLSVIMARKHLEAADVSLLVLDATDGVAALDANIGGYAHESGRHPPRHQQPHHQQQSQHQPSRPWPPPIARPRARRPQKPGCPIHRSIWRWVGCEELRPQSRPQALRAAGPRPPQVPRLRPTCLRLRHHRRRRRGALQESRTRRPRAPQARHHRPDEPLPRRRRLPARLGPHEPPRQNLLHDPGRRRPAHLRPLHRPRRPSPLRLRALPRQPDPRRLRLHRRPHLVQTPPQNQKDF